jgi:hypothetical protein
MDLMADCVDAWFSRVVDSLEICYNDPDGQDTMKIFSRLSGIALLLFGLCWPAMAQIGPQGAGALVVTTCGTLPLAYKPGAVVPPTQDINGNLCSAATVSASVSGFLPVSHGTPISVTTGGVTGTLPTNTGEVIATNVGTTNGAYCALGASATTSDQYIAPNGGWFGFTVTGSTQLTCITSTSTTTVNMVGGSGLPTGTGGGGGGGSGGSVTQGTSPWVVGQATAANLNMTEASAAAILSAVQGAIPAGTNPIGSVLPNAATSTQTKVTITTASTYQQYLASTAGRKGCTIQFITAAHTGYVFFGAAPGDTTTSFQLSPGQTLNCNTGPTVLTDAIQLTSSNNSDVFVVNSW